MPAAVVDRILRRRKLGIGKRADRNADEGLLAAFLGVEQRGAADRAEAEREAAAMVADAHVFGRGAGDLVWCGVTGQRGEHAAGAALAGEAMADADAARLALNLDAQLAAGTGGGSRIHSVPLMQDAVSECEPRCLRSTRFFRHHILRPYSNLYPQNLQIFAAAFMYSAH